MGHVRDEITNYVHIWQRSYFNGSCCGKIDESDNQRNRWFLQDGNGIGVRQAKLFFPFIFIAQLPQIPSRQLLRNDNVES